MLVSFRALVSSAAVSLCLLAPLVASTDARAGAISISFAAMFAGQIETPDTIFPFIDNPFASGSMIVDMAAPNAAVGSANVPFTLPNATVVSISDGPTDTLTVAWFLIDSNPDIFHLTLDFDDPTGSGVSGGNLTSDIGGWTLINARLDRGSDNVCCNLLPMDLSVGDVSISVVPEPASMLMLGVGLAGIAISRRRQA
jgi:hypothetical protein